VPDSILTAADPHCDEDVKKIRTTKIRNKFRTRLTRNESLKLVDFVGNPCRA